MDVRTLCLAVLTRGDATGYEIKKAFEEGPFSHFQRASFGSIYPALSRLLSDNLVEAHAQEQDGRPDKKVYSITPAGRFLFEEALRGTPEPDAFRSDFLFMLLFASRFDERTLADLIDRWIADYRAREAEIAGEIAARTADGQEMAPGCRFVAGFGVEIYRTMADYLAANRDGLIERLRATRASDAAAAAE